MHHLPDLAQHNQTALICATVLGLGLVIVRGSLACYRHWAAVPHQYPVGWSDAHIRILEQLRTTIGLALGVTWAVLLVASPQMPSSAPFGLLPALYLIVLLLVTNAWVRLMIPSEWKHTFIGKMKFEHAVGCLLVVWTILLGGSLFAIAKSTTSIAERPVHLLGTFA